MRFSGTNSVTRLAVGHTKPLRLFRLRLRVPTPTSPPKNFCFQVSGLHSFMRRWSETIAHTAAGDASTWMLASRGATGVLGLMRILRECVSGLGGRRGQLAWIALASVEPLDQPVRDTGVVEQGEVVGARDVLEPGALDHGAGATDTGGRGEV